MYNIKSCKEFSCKSSIGLQKMIYEELLDLLISNRHGFEAGTPQYTKSGCVSVLFEGMEFDIPCDINSNAQPEKFDEDNSIKDQKIVDKTKNSMWRF